MAYPGPQDINVSQGLPRIWNYVADITGSWFVNMLLIAIFVIVSMTMYRTTNNFIVGLAGGAFASFLISLIFFVGGFVTPVIFGLNIAFMLIAMLGLFLNKK